MSSSFVKSLMRTKKVGEEKGSQLKRTLGALDLTLLGIGAIIGAGIFVLTGITAANQSGPAVILSYAISGVICALAALAYAELGAAVGGSGSAYSYSYATFGELIAWIIGWDLILEYVVVLPAVAAGWSGYIQNILTNIGLPIPEYLGKSWRDGGLFNLPASLVILFLMFVLNSGVKQSTRLNAGIVAVKLIAVAVFILVALFHVDPANWSPFMPYGWFSAGADGKPVGVLAGASIVFFAYIGFDAVTTAAEEAKDPQKNLPIGILGSLAVCTVVFIAMSVLLTGMVPYTELGVAAPVAYALTKTGATWASALVSAGAVAGLTSVLLVMYYGATRLIFAITRDGLLPSGLAKVNPKSHVPQTIITVVGLFSAFIAGFFPLNELAELINIGTLAAFVLVCLGVAVLRKTHPNLRRPYKNPLGSVGAILGALGSFGLMLTLPHTTWVRLGVWFVVGLIIYFSYSRYNSRLAKKK